MSATARLSPFVVPDRTNTGPIAARLRSAGGVEEPLSVEQLRGWLTPVLEVGEGQGRPEPHLTFDTDAAGTAVTVIGFREHASFALNSEVIEFVDLEDIDGVFREPLPRITLDTLPDTGAWLPPFRSLRSLLEPRR
jgi:hypothetical protein